ncbi:hypothetical protein B0H16DRAFT_1883138 [Mycena metata]|uniref:Uncharacterized protein n=1 Tax=Mycena metata TaxID=1033252 RepID=A0AAD7JMQ9_9AGAR|nr:hypothetical protein B0H16DRAFT_1883138 [Mycena metata]
MRRLKTYIGGIPQMPPSYNIRDLPFNIEGPETVLTKEQHGLFRVDSASSSSHSSTHPSTTFRGKRILILGFCICLAIILLTVGLCIEIFVTHEYIHRGLDIITAAPLGSILAIVHALSVLLILALPFVMGLHGYRLAWAWLVASADSGHNRPTPFQLGIIMNILHGANFSALWAGIKYMYGIFSQKRSSYKPSILRRALFVLGFGLGIAYSFVVLDIALDISSTTLAFSQLDDYTGTWPELSRQLNYSMCATTEGAVANGINLCGLEVAGSNPFSASLPEALSTLSNNSASNAVAFGNDGTAFIVPASIPQDVAYYGTSYGVLSQCQSVTDQCIGSGSIQTLNLSCPASVSFNAAFNATTNSYPFGILDNSGDQYTTPYMVDTNPFNFGAVVSSEAYTSSADTFVGNTGFFAYGDAGTSYNVLTCSVTVRSVGYTYFNQTFTIDALSTAAVTNLDITRGIAAMTATEYLSIRVPAAVDGAGLTGEPYIAAFARELSRELIAFTASAYEPALPGELQSVTQVLGARLPLVLLVLILIWIVVYCGLILFLTISAILASNASPYTLLARNRLAEPLTAVHTAYGRAEPHRTWEQSNQRLFSVETGLDRLSVGPTTSNAGGLAFGISRAVAAPLT